MITKTLFLHSGSLSRLVRAGRRCLLGCVAAGTLAATSWAQPAAPRTITIHAVVGLKFDPARFVVSPGEKVRLKFINPDDMIHNLVITKPEARMTVVTAALALGAKGPALHFVPEIPEVLWATRTLNIGEETTLEFTAPTTEGVYPYVCTFPGHGFLMYGAMYVADSSVTLPPLAEDPHIPEQVGAAGSETHEHALIVGEKPQVSRTFMADSGPASIAIGLPGGQSYCFDAGACRLRYIWRGGFIDSTAQWSGKGDTFTKVEGQLYYRMLESNRLRAAPRDQPVATRWLGYRLQAGYPELKYELDGALVREIARAKVDGTGLAITYRIEGAKGDVSFRIENDAGATVEWYPGVCDPMPTTAGGLGVADGSGRLFTLSPEEARQFTVVYTERVGVEPLGYWSMDDLYLPGRRNPVAGVVNRAYSPGEWLHRGAALDTYVAWGDIEDGATLMCWAQADPELLKGESAGPVFGTMDADVHGVVTDPVPDGEWHHLALVRDGDQRTIFLDGEVIEVVKTATWPSGESTISIGSSGTQTFYRGLLDEVRLFDRPLTGPEIRQLMTRDLGPKGSRR